MQGAAVSYFYPAGQAESLYAELQARGFMTGVRADNASSQALCAKLGVGPTDWIYAQCIDRTLFSGAITK